MGYTTPTLDQLHAYLIGVWKFQFPLSNVGSRFSFHWKRLRAYAGAATDLHAHIDSAIRNVMPDTTSGSFLTRWGNALGVAKKGATGARGTAALTVLGVVGSSVTAGMQLTHGPTGFTFQVTSSTTIPAAGFVNVDVAAISTGAATRLSAGESLTFVASNPGLQMIAKLALALTVDGFDTEQDPAYSVRVNAQLGEPRMGGHQLDFVAWMLQIPGIASAYAYPNRAGIGTIDLVGFHAGTGTGRSLTAPEMASALAYVKSKVPAQLGAQYSALRVLTTNAIALSVEIVIVPNGDPQYAHDWDDSGGGPVVLSYNATTRTVVFTASLPASLLASERAVFRGVASVQDGRVFTIDTIATTTYANDTVTLRETPAVAIAATDQMYAGGPLTAIVRDAILAHMNGEIVYADRGQPIGAGAALAKGLSIPRLNILVDAMGPANPGGAYGSWNGDLLMANVNRIAGYASGVRNMINVNPNADQILADLVFPADAATQFITPAFVLVRSL